MEKRTKLIIGAIVLIVLVVIMFVVVQKPTGQATFTPGANYGPVQPNFNILTDCKYLNPDDGWDVTVKTEVQYRDRRNGRTETYADACTGSNSVTELHCEDGYRKARTVNCPSGTSCKDGACVAQ
jgi:hypothetical protein